MIRHQEVGSDKPCCGPEPSLPKNPMRIFASQPGSAVKRVDGQENDTFVKGMEVNPP